MVVFWGVVETAMVVAVTEREQKARAKSVLVVPEVAATEVAVLEVVATATMVSVAVATRGCVAGAEVGEGRQMANLVAPLV